MSNEIVVHIGKTNVITINFGMDLSADTLTSEIRSQPDSTSTLIATLVVAPVTTGSDGKYTLTLGYVASGQIVAASGFMDVKRVSAGEPLPLFDEPLEVIFRKPVTQ